MSPEKQALLMSKNKIAYDRSEDLRPPVPGSTHAADVDSDDTGDEAAMPIRIKAATAPSAAPHKEVSVSKKRRRIIESDDEETVDLEETEVSETEEEEEELPIRQKRKPANARVIAKGRVKKGVEEDSTDESEEDEEEEVDANALLGADGLMPGQRRFMQTVGALEQRLKSLPQEEDDDDVLDFDHLTTDEEDDDEEYTPPPRKSERLKNQRNPSESVLKDASKTSSLHVKHSIFAQKRTHSQIERAQEEEATEDLGKESAAKRRRV